MTSVTEQNFYRQRRLLLLTSLLLAIYSIYGFPFRLMYVLGNDVLVTENTLHSMRCILVLLFVYSLWRYYSYCSELRAAEKLRTSYLNMIGALCKKAAEDRMSVFTCLKAKDFDLAKEEFAFNGRSITSVSYRVALDVAEIKAKNLPPEEIINIEQNRDILINGRALKVIKTIAAIKTLLQGVAFSEYVLPYLFALASLCTALFFAVYHF